MNKHQLIMEIRRLLGVGEVSGLHKLSREDLADLRNAIAGRLEPSPITPLPRKTVDPDVLLSAHDRRISVFGMRSASILLEGDPAHVAEWLVDNGIESWMNSSSMDFGRDYGFDEDNLRALLCMEITAIKATRAKNASAT